MKNNEVTRLPFWEMKKPEGAMMNPEETRQPSWEIRLLNLTERKRKPDGGQLRIWDSLNVSLVSSRGKGWKRTRTKEQERLQNKDQSVLKKCFPVFSVPRVGERRGMADEEKILDKSSF